VAAAFVLAGLRRAAACRASARGGRRFSLLGGFGGIRVRSCGTSSGFDLLRPPFAKASGRLADGRGLASIPKSLTQKKIFGFSSAKVVLVLRPEAG